MGFIALGTSLVALAIIRQRAPSAVRRKLVDWAAFREPPYTLFTLGNTLGFMGSYGSSPIVPAHCVLSPRV